MIRTLSIAAAVVALAGCASATEVESVTHTPRPPVSDTCGAAAYQHLVGKPRSEIPAKPAGAVWRIHSTTHAVTMDYSEKRLNIVWDAETEVIKSVSCG